MTDRPIQMFYKAMLLWDKAHPAVSKTMVRLTWIPSDPFHVHVKTPVGGFLVSTENLLDDVLCVDIGRPVVVREYAFGMDATGFATLTGAPLLVSDRGRNLSKLLFETAHVNEFRGMVENRFPEAYSAWAAHVQQDVDLVLEETNMWFQGGEALGRQTFPFTIMGVDTSTTSIAVSWLHFGPENKDGEDGVEIEVKALKALTRLNLKGQWDAVTEMPHIQSVVRTLATVANPFPDDPIVGVFIEDTPPMTRSIHNTLKLGRITAVTALTFREALPYARVQLVKVDQWKQALDKGGMSKQDVVDKVSELFGEQNWSQDEYDATGVAWYGFQVFLGEAEEFLDAQGQ